MSDKLQSACRFPRGHSFRQGDAWEHYFGLELPEEAGRACLAESYLVESVGEGDRMTIAIRSDGIPRGTIVFDAARGRIERVEREVECAGAGWTYRRRETVERE